MLCVSPLPLPQIKHVAKGRGAAATCSRITYKHVQRCGVIEELLREVAVARGPGAACPHGLGEVLLHQHGGQRDGLKPRHSKAVGDEPVHQSGTCGGGERQLSDRGNTVVQGQINGLLPCKPSSAETLWDRHKVTVKGKGDKVRGPPCASIYPMSKRKKTLDNSDASIPSTGP